MIEIFGIIMTVIAFILIIIGLDRQKVFSRITTDILVILFTLITAGLIMFFTLYNVLN